MELTSAHKKFCAVVREEFFERQNRNPQYSTRAFARQLGVQPATISEIIRDKRRVSRSYAEDLLMKLCIEDSTIREVLSEFDVSPQVKRRISTSYKTQNASLIDLDTYKVISDWEHLAILSLVRTKGFKSDANWIANRLGISGKRAAEAVRRLFDAKLLAKSGHRWVRTAERLKTSDGIANKFLQKAHLNNLRLAEEALVHSLYEWRDEFAATLAMNPHALPQLRREVRKSVERLMRIGEKHPEPSEVYKISLHIFPITKNQTKGRKNESSK